MSERRRERTKPVVTHKMRTGAAQVHALLDDLNRSNRSVDVEGVRYVSYDDIIPVLLHLQGVSLVTDLGQENLRPNMAVLTVAEVPHNVRIVLARKPDECRRCFQSPSFNRLTDVVLAPGLQKNVVYQFTRQIHQIIDPRKKST